MFENSQSQPPIAMMAIDLLFSADFSDQVIARTLGQDDSKKKASSRLLSQLASSFAGGSFNRLFSKVADLFPKSVMESDPWLKSYRDSYRKIPGLVQSKLLGEANEWAEYAMRELPDLVIELCSSETGREFMARGIDVALSTGRSMGKKKNDKLKEKFFTRMSSNIPSIEKAIQEAHAQMDPDTCVLIAADRLLGGLSPFIHYALASQYAYYIVYLIMVSVGLPEESTEYFHSLCEVSNIEFSEEVAEFSEVIDDFGTEALTVAFAKENISAFVSRSVLRHMNACSILARNLETANVEHSKQIKLKEKTEADLRKALSEASATIERLRSGSRDEELRAVNDENRELKKEIAKLTGDLSLKEQRIVKLENQPVAMLSHGRKAAPEAKTERPEKPQVQATTSPKEDLDYLKNLKVTIVGGHPIFHHKIAKILPGWNFYDAEETGVEEAAVRNSDLIIFHTQYCSHKLTEGTLNKARQMQKPVGYAYKVNPPAFFAEVAEIAKKALSVTAEAA